MWRAIVVLLAALATLSVLGSSAAISQVARGKDLDRDLNRPFLVGAEKVFTPNATGVLFLKIHDTEENDNQGQLTVTISGQVREL